MDLLTRDCRQREDAQGGPAIMLFGKNLSPQSSYVVRQGEKIKEELQSPRGVDEKGLSFATTSSDDEDVEDLKDAHVHAAERSAASPYLTTSVSVREQSAPSPYLASSVSVPATAVTEPVKKRKLSSSDDADCSVVRQSDEDGGMIQASKPAAVISTDQERDDQYSAGRKPADAGAWSRCPRCDSSDTKFCYFNNYNVNQPRHFCKNCQRYWTAGGTLRNVPVGAGRRKNKHTLHVKHSLMIHGSPTHTPTAAPAVGDLTIASAPAKNPDHPLLSAPKLDPLTSMSATTHLDQLSAAHPLSAGSSLPYSSSSTPSQETSAARTYHPGSQQQLHGNLQSRSSQINRSGYLNLSQVYPHLQHGAAAAAAAAGLRQVCPASPCEYAELAGLGSHNLGSRPSLLCCTTCPDHAQNGSSRLCYTGAPAGLRYPFPHPVQNGSCRLRHSCACVHNRSCQTAHELCSDDRTGDHKLSAMEKSERRSSAKSLPVDVGNTGNAPKHCVGDDGSTSLPKMARSPWPCFPSMFWLDPRAFPHVVRPVLTRQGWALPFVTPSAASKIQPTSCSHHLTKGGL